MSVPCACLVPTEAIKGPASPGPKVKKPGCLRQLWATMWVLWEQWQVLGGPGASLQLSPPHFDFLYPFYPWSWDQEDPHFSSFSSQTNRKSLNFLYVAPSSRLFVDTKLSPDPQGALWGSVLSQKVHPHPTLLSRGHLWEHSSLDNCSHINKILLLINRLLLLPNTTRTRVAKPWPDMAKLCMLAGVFFNMV